MKRLYVYFAVPHSFLLLFLGGWSAFLAHEGRHAAGGSLHRQTRLAGGAFAGGLFPVSLDAQHVAEEHLELRGGNCEGGIEEAVGGVSHWFCA